MHEILPRHLRAQSPVHNTAGIVKHDIGRRHVVHQHRVPLQPLLTAYSLEADVADDKIALLQKGDEIVKFCGPLFNIDMRSVSYRLRHITRRFLRRPNLALANRLRLLLNRRGRGAWTAEHPWWPELQRLWTWQLEHNEPSMWEISPWTRGARPFMGLTSHQEEKLQEGSLSSYHPSQEFARVNAAADTAVTGSADDRDGEQGPGQDDDAGSGDNVH